MSEHVYTFDVRLWAVVRVTAESESEARRLLARTGFSGAGVPGGVKVGSVEPEDGPADLVEVDGEWPESS